MNELFVGTGVALVTPFLSDKKIDMSGPQGITITDELSPAERTNLLRRAKGSVVDVQVSNMR